MQLLLLLQPCIHRRRCCCAVATAALRRRCKAEVKGRRGTRAEEGQGMRDEGMMVG